MGSRASLGLSLVVRGCSLVRLAMLLILVSVFLRQVWSSCCVLQLDLGLLFCYPPLNSTLRSEVQSLSWGGLLGRGARRPVAFCIMFGTSLGSLEGPRGVSLERFRSLSLYTSSVLTRP